MGGLWLDLRCLAVEDVYGNLTGGRGLTSEGTIVNSAKHSASRNPGWIPAPAYYPLG